MYYKTGDEIEIIIPLKNNGGIAATNVEVTVSIPAGIGIVSMSIPVGTWNSSVWSISTLNPGENLSATLTVSVLDDTELPGTVAWSVNADEIDADSYNNINTFVIEGLAYILPIVSITSDDDTVAVSETIEGNHSTYDLSVNNQENALKGNNWVIFGDSFSDDINNEYSGYVKTILDLGNVVTNAVSGNKIAQQLAILDGLLVANPDYFDDFDIVSLLIGANDFAQNTALGTRASLSSEASVAGYLKDFIETVLTAKPTVKLFIMCPTEANALGILYKATNVAGYTIGDMAILYSQICSDYSVQFIDLYSLSGFNLQTIPIYTVDLLHPNALGNERLGKLIASAFLDYRNGLSIHNNSDFPSYTDTAILYGENGSVGEDERNFQWDYTNKLLTIGQPTNTDSYGLEFKYTAPLTPTLQAYIKHYINTAILKINANAPSGSIRFHINEDANAKFIINSTGILYLFSPTYADEAAAAAAGLATGYIYKTATGELRIKL